MFRYVCVVRNTRNAHHEPIADGVRMIMRRSEGWHAVFDTRRVQIYCTATEHDRFGWHPLGDAGGALGIVFERLLDSECDEPTAHAAIDSDETARIVASRGKRLITHYWGNYVAVISDPDASTTRVIKDPSGDLPCFYIERSGTHIFLSCIDDCFHLNLHLTINEHYVLDRMLSAQRLSEHAPLHEVAAVRRGECVEITSCGDSERVTRTSVWNPMHFLGADDLIEDADTAARMLRNVVHRCTRTLASGHMTILHRLSGGLDSSIVAGCLRAEPAPRVLHYTHYNPAGQSDERRWARMVARFAGCEHIECPLEPSAIDLRKAANLSASYEPLWPLEYLARAPLERQLTDEYSATLITTGDGGDSGFCRDSVADVVVEFLRLHGLRPKALSLATQLARQLEQSVWTTLFGSVAAWLSRSTMIRVQSVALEASRLVSSEVRSAQTQPRWYPQPWHVNARSSYWSTIRRLGALAFTPTFYDFSVEPGRRVPQVVSPLYSQPAIELFFRIPLYVHFHGGRDRGLARRAFQEDVPAPILRRHWKDRAPGFFDQVVHRNRNFLRELLLDGVLATRGLLDREATEDALAAVPTRSAVIPAEILKHMATEVWMRRWLDTNAQRYAPY